MHQRELISKLDEQRIAAAIAVAEKKTSGEIRVYISHKERHDVMAFAQKRFVQLGMTKTQHRNAVLIYIVPRTCQFAVLGDIGIHQRCGEGFWKEIVTTMSAQMKDGQFTEAVVGAISKITETLARHFPRQPDDRNELPDSIASD